MSVLNLEMSVLGDNGSSCTQCISKFKNAACFLTASNHPGKSCMVLDSEEDPLLNKSFVVAKGMQRPFKTFRTLQIL